jgi:hypothetical protein
MTLFWFLWVLALTAVLSRLGALAAWCEWIYCLVRRPVPLALRRRGLPLTDRMVRCGPPGSSRAELRTVYVRALAPRSPVSVTRIDRLRLLIGDALGFLRGS